ncbi:MAG: VanZ family protein [Syntrophothermus sp.]
MFKIKEATSQAQHKKARALAIFYITLTLAYMVTIYRFSSLPGSQVSLPAPDYVMHALEYFGLGVLLGLTARSAVNMYKTSARPSNSHFLAPIFIGFAYALSDEFHQFFVPGRNASVSDLLADLSGVIAAQILLQYWLSTRATSSR